MWRVARGVRALLALAQRPAACDAEVDEYTRRYERRTACCICLGCVWLLCFRLALTPTPEWAPAALAYVRVGTHCEADYTAYTVRYSTATGGNVSNETRAVCEERDATDARLAEPRTPCAAHVRYIVDHYWRLANVTHFVAPATPAAAAATTQRILPLARVPPLFGPLRAQHAAGHAARRRGR